MADAAHVDVLAFGAHPDDVELFAGGTIATLVARGHRVAIVDLTRGELGSRGTPAIRAKEAAAAAEILGVSHRENLGLPDGDIANTAENRWRVLRAVRKYRPHIALIGATACRHPDHPAATRLVSDGLFAAGLARLESTEAGLPQEPWRAAHVLHYMQHVDFEPSVVVDVTDAWETRMQALAAYATQFHVPDGPDDEPETYVSSRSFLEWVEARARTFGHRIGVRYGEPLRYASGPIAVTDLMTTFPGTPPR
jgi:bacillithiol biosynthesis deacetylase BshB1